MHDCFLVEARVVLLGLLRVLCGLAMREACYLTGLHNDDAPSAGMAIISGYGAVLVASGGSFLELQCVATVEMRPSFVELIGEFMDLLTKSV